MVDSATGQPLRSSSGYRPSGPCHRKPSGFSNRRRRYRRPPRTSPLRSRPSGHIAVGARTLRGLQSGLRKERRRNRQFRRLRPTRTHPGQPQALGCPLRASRSSHRAPKPSTESGGARHGRSCQRPRNRLGAAAAFERRSCRRATCRTMARPTAGPKRFLHRLSQRASASGHDNAGDRLDPVSSRRCWSGLETLTPRENGRRHSCGGQVQ